MKAAAVCSVFLAASLTVGCKSRSPPPQPAETEAASPAWFAEVGSTSGIDFVHCSGHDGKKFLLPESAAGGGAFFDMDGDGYLDVYLVQSVGSSNRLYRNLDGRRFADVTEGSGAGDRGYGIGVTTGDYDQDGDLDLYVTNVGPNVLLRNDGGGRFTDVTAEAHVGDPGFGSSAAFFDADGDGDLDLYVVNYLVWSPERERRCTNRLGGADYCDPTGYDAPAMDVLYRNEGAGPGGAVRFTDISRAAGLASAFGNGLGVLAADFGGDGRVDLFVANDRTPNQLWVNLGTGADGVVRFEDQALIAGCAMDENGRAKAGMGIGAVDIDDDGDSDLVVMNFSDESDSFFRNEGSYFTDATAAVGLAAASRPLTRFGVGFVDFDNDGLVDLYEAAGRVARQAPSYGEDPYSEPDLLFRGTPGGRFEEVLPRGGVTAQVAAASRAAAFGDFDNDGGVDVLVVHRDARVHLLHNVVAPRGHWTLIRLLDEHGRDAIGATVSFDLGERRISRTLRTAYSYCSANDPRVHAGLGQQAQVRAVAVDWGDGRRDERGDFPADQVLTLRRKPPTDD